MDRPVVVFDEYGPVRMIRDKEWKLVLRYPYGPNELYHLTADPDETQNLFDDPVFQDQILTMRRQLEEWFLSYSDPDLDAPQGRRYRHRPVLPARKPAHLVEKYGPMPAPVKDE